MGELGRCLNHKNIELLYIKNLNFQLIKLILSDIFNSKLTSGYIKRVSCSLKPSPETPIIYYHIFLEILIQKP